MKVNGFHIFISLQQDLQKHFSLGVLDHLWDIDPYVVTCAHIFKKKKKCIHTILKQFKVVVSSSLRLSPASLLSLDWLAGVFRSRL